MKKVILITATVLTLASAVAYAQMQSGPQQNMPMQPGQAPMMNDGQMMGRDMMGQGGMHGMMHGARQGVMHSGQTKGDTGPSSLAFRGINAKMHEAMDITYTGNPDVDFVRGMIPHHQGAIDMAKTVQAFGKNPEVKKLAEDIIKAQEGEIAWMNEWLKKNAQ
jgi:uncharacterized protein (DUF305 family)